MTDVVSHQTNPKHNAHLATPDARNLRIPLPSPARNSNQNGLMTLGAFSPVTQYGSFEFDRIIKAGQVSKRTRRTKTWKPIYIVLRPNLLSIYRDKHESDLRHQINLSELTAIARQRDPKRRDKHVFGLFSPSRNYHLEANTEKEAQEWVELIRREAKIDEDEEEMYLSGPGESATSYQGFERSIDASISQGANDRSAGGYSSSDAEALTHQFATPRQRDRGASNLSSSNNRRMSHPAVDYSGAEHGSLSDFSDSIGARMSSLSLAYTDGRPSTSSNHPAQPNSVYGTASARPSMGARNPSQMSTTMAGGPDENRNASTAANSDSERVIYHGWIYLLKSKSGMRQWKRVWMVLRPKALAIYKNDEEYAALMILPFPNIIDVVEIDPISRTKTACMQIISDERNYRFAALDEESLARWLGGFKSLLAKRKMKAG